MVEPRATRIVRDVSYLLTGQIAVGAVGLVTSAWLARNLPEGELSAWPALISLVAITYTLSNFGLRDSCVRSVPRLLSEGQEKKVGRMLRTSVLLTVSGSFVLSGLVYVLASNIDGLMLKNEVPVGVVRLLAIAVLLTTVSTHFEWFLNALQRYKWLAATRAVRNIVRPVASVVLYWFGGIQGAVLGLAIGPLLGCLFSAWVLLPYLRRGTGFMPLGMLLPQSFPYYVSGISAGLISRLDYILVGALGGTKNLATYFVACRVVEYLQLLDTYLLDAMTPKLAEKATEGPAESSRTFSKCSRYFFLGLLPLHCALAAVGRPIIRLYAGSGYDAAGLIFSVLAIYLLLDTFFALYRRNIIVLGNRWHPFVLDTLLASMNVGLISVLSAYYGGLGAAAGRGIAVILVLPLAVWLTRRIFVPKHSSQGLLLGAIGSLSAVGIAVLWMRLFDSTAIQSTALVASGVVYVLILHRQLTKDDMNIMRGLMPGRIRDSSTGQRISAMLERFYVRKSVPEASVTSQ